MDALQEKLAAYRLERKAAKIGVPTAAGLGALVGAAAAGLSSTGAFPHPRPTVV